MGRRYRPGLGAPARVKLRALADQIVIITGGSSGIGRETALRMARSGAQVVVISRDEAGLTRTVRDIVSEGGRARHLVCDAVGLLLVGVAGRADGQLRLEGGGPQRQRAPDGAVSA